MSIEQFPSSAEQEQNRRITCFLEGVCPHCGDSVDDTQTGGYLGFCNERHLSTYQTDHAVDVRLDYKKAHGERLHTEYLQNTADDLGIPVDLFKQLHDVEHLSIAAIKTQLEEYQKRKAA
jgi:hypothetical protein